MVMPRKIPPENLNFPAGWVVRDKKGPLIFLKFKYRNKQDVLILNMALKVAYGYQIKSYEQFKFENLKF